MCISRLIYYDAQITKISKLTSILNSNARHYNTQLNNPIVNQIKNDLTHFASGYVIQQFLSLDKTAFQFNQISSDPAFNVVCSNTSCVVTFNNCTCYILKILVFSANILCLCESRMVFQFMSQCI